MTPRVPGKPARFRRSVSLLWRTLDWSRRLTINLLFLAVVVIFLGALMSERKVDVPHGAVLVLDPRGEIVEQLSYEPPAMLLLREGIEEGGRNEVLVQDLVDALELAAADGRIKALLLDMEGLRPSGLSKLQALGTALQRFRAADKRVIARGEHYTQSQYFLAAHADELYLHPMGVVFLQGFGVYRTYFRSALERLRIQVHAFQVGTYKSALEPFLRDDMSTADREATMDWLQVLWNAYCRDVAAQRNLPLEAVHTFADELPAQVEQVDGDLARLALERGLVDSLADGQQVRQRLIGLVGEQNGDFRQIGFRQYLRAVRTADKSQGPADARVGLVVARGMILGGKQHAGRIGAETVGALLRRAREDDAIRAVVLRLDTGGGSALAAETIRREVVLTQRAGKPVVASLSSVAASGGYWVASAADEIWAAPTTLTGSIGIFGAIPTFQSSLDALGIHTDGVGTTHMADAFDPRRELDPGTARVIQQTVEHGYARFLQVVAAGRGMTRDEVDAVGQGRVWAGTKAQELGLVDHLGETDAAVAAAADLAGLEDYGVTPIEPEADRRETLMRWLAGLAAGALAPQDPGWIRLLGQLNAQVTPVMGMTDPQGLYAWCLRCSAL